MNPDRQNPIPRFPTGLLAFAHVLTAASVIGLAWHLYDANRFEKELKHRHIRCVQLQGVIIHLDEVLTMSARMAAATGDLNWEKRYRHYEPELDAAIKEATQLAPQPALVQMAPQTDAANLKLVDMENRAFDLVHHGQLEQARAVLFSPAYEEQKQIYAAGITHLLEELNKQWNAKLHSEEIDVWLSILITVVVLIVLVVAWFGTMRMLTRWRVTLQAEVAERRRAEAQLERFFATSLDVLCVAGFDGYFKKLNRVWEQTLGWTNDELLAKPFLEFVHPDDKAATVAVVQKLAAGENIISFENRYLCKDGSYRWVLWQATPTVDEGLIFAGGHDVTKRKLREEEVGRLNADLSQRSTALEAANKELEAFSYSVSHDLRAPLRGIDGFCGILAEDYAPRLDDTGKDYLQRVRAAARRMAELIDDLLGLSRITRAEMKREPVNLSELAQMVAAELQRREPDRQVELVIAAGLAAEGDRQLLRVALENLLGNAWKFSGKKPGARIEFGRLNGGSASVPTADGGDGLDGARPSKNDAVFFVRDNGAGFDMQHAGKLFGVFQRLHAMTEFEGTGIGLATVQRIIHRHSGRVWAEAEVNKGATFYFTL